jgi:Xaa-Pro dipeptidase
LHTQIEKRLEMILPTIPTAEYNTRKVSIQNLMNEFGFDILFFYGDDRAVFGANHTRWIANYAPHFEPVLIAVPKVGDIHAATGAESETFFNNTAKIGTVHVVDEFNMPEEEYPYTKSKSFKDFCDTLNDEVGGPVVNVGVVGESSTPVWLHSLLSEAGYVIEISEAFEIAYRLLRASKSDAEVEVLKYGFEIAEAGFDAGLTALKEGVSERDVAAEIEYTMRKMGSEGSGIDTIVGFGKTNTYPILTRTTHNKLKSRDLALLTIAPRYEGYHGVIARPIVIGEPYLEVKKAIEGAIKASEASAEQLKIGARGSDISGAGLEVLKKAGLVNLCVYSGIHSVGTSEFEPPILTSKSDFIVPKNFFVSIDVPLFFASWGGLRVETGYLVTEESVVRLCSSPLSYLEI